MFDQPTELSSNREWMLQSGQLNPTDLLTALVFAGYEGVYRRRSLF